LPCGKKRQIATKKEARGTNRDGKGKRVPQHERGEAKKKKKKVRAHEEKGSLDVIWGKSRFPYETL